MENKLITENVCWELALLAMQCGKKVRHVYFTDKEPYIFMENNIIQGFSLKNDKPELWEQGTVEKFLEGKCDPNGDFTQRGWYIL